MPDDPARVPPFPPLTRREYQVVRLIACGQSPPDIAAALGVTVHAIEYHTVNASNKIPGDLPRTARIVAWWRGASREVLEGHAVNPLQVALWKAQGGRG